MLQIQKTLSLTMLKPKSNKLIFSFFAWYISRIIKTDFRKLKFNAEPFLAEQAILLLANHFSWWDGFMLFQINRIYFKKNFHVLITEENYKKVWFLKYLGCFSVRKKSKDLIYALEYAGSLLNDPSNLVLIFPQGRLHANHVLHVDFEKGLLRIINASNKQFQFLFSATFVNYFEHRKPTATCYLQYWKADEFTSLQLIKSAYNKHYETSRQLQASITV